MLNLQGMLFALATGQLLAQRCACRSNLEGSGGMQDPQVALPSSSGAPKGKKAGEGIYVCQGQMKQTRPTKVVKLGNSTAKMFPSSWTLYLFGSNFRGSQTFRLFLANALKKKNKNAMVTSFPKVPRGCFGFRVS